MKDLKAIRFTPGTKVSHDYSGSEVRTWSYADLWKRGVVNVGNIGIPCKQNKLIIIDVDTPGIKHQHDGREFWTKFCAEWGIPETYTVSTPAGGFHYYFRLPEAVNPETFAPCGKLADGVDVKWNGWAGAPPSPGYNILLKSSEDISEAPPSLLMALTQGRERPQTFDGNNSLNIVNIHSSFSPNQIEELRTSIPWIQQHVSLSREEWRNGLFALKAGVDDPVVLEELATMWTMNKAYSPGDEHQAIEIVARADRFGAIGPGSIFAIMHEARIREGAPVAPLKRTALDVLETSKVPFQFNKDGSLRLELSESNAAALIASCFSEQELYHDRRCDMFMFKGKSVSDVGLVNTLMPHLQSKAFGLGFDKFRKSTISTGVDILMGQRSFDPHQMYLKGLVWDGVPRIGKFFPEYVCTEDTSYTRLIGRNFWVSLAARGLVPGTKFDSMVVLEGAEGIHKSSLVQAIGGEYTFAPPSKKSLDDLDILRQMHQATIVELPELSGLTHQTADYVKAFLATSTDNIRGLFAKKAMKNPRGFVFVGTTNKSKYLTVAMGIRRYWPIKVGGRIKLSAIRSDRDQLYAEAIACYKDGCEFWDVPKDMLLREVRERIVADPLIKSVEDMIAYVPGPYTTTSVYKYLEGQGIIGRGLTAQVSDRIESSLTYLGFEEESGSWTKEGEKVESFSLSDFI